jgi:RHS repeat-associated protein
VRDGWDLIEEYQSGGAPTATYLYGAGGLIAGMANGQFNYYYQDGSGSTSHLADTTEHLVEWYRYDLQGTPIFYNANDTQRNPNQSGYSVRHLFTGQQWYSDLGLYDLRNRFYSPDLGRFLQPDPIGFWGGNNPVMWRDPSGLSSGTVMILQEAQTDPVNVTGTYFSLNEIGYGDGYDGAPLGIGVLRSEPWRIWGVHRGRARGRTRNSKLQPVPASQGRSGHTAECTATAKPAATASIRPTTLQTPLVPISQASPSALPGIIHTVTASTFAGIGLPSSQRLWPLRSARSLPSRVSCQSPPTRSFAPL